jgi:YggT family protein
VITLLREFVCILLQILLLTLFARAILSWFPIQPGTVLATISGVLARVTDPMLVPLRRIVPRAGMFDLSFVVLFLILLILMNVICGGTGFGI